ncbi:MAG TPA: hypothetical protein VLL76_10630 [Candidatus Omnitrophota bacterium]|nr:hypothetical protein [Candidatus Omnitrophota bacterium]
MLSAIALCSRALLKIGAGTIASFDEGTAESEVAANLYDSTRDALLSAYPWNFATGQATLPRLAATPVADYDHAYQLPSDFLRAISAGEEAGSGLNYRIAESRLHTNAPAVVLTYVFRPAEEDFPPFFDQALIARLAADFCLPLTESASRADLLYRLAEDEYRKAKLTDAQQDVPSAITHFPLVDVRG